MSKSNTRSFIIRLFVFVVALALVGTDLIVSAQNTNSGTTMQNDNMSAQNSNMSGTNMNRRGRQGSRRGNANTGMANANTTGDMQGNVNTGEATSNANMTGKTSMGGRRRRGRRRAGNMGAAITASTTPVRTGRCDPNVQEQTDLSGTYTGTVNYAEGGLSGDVTLTITGNDFTVTGGSTTVSGRVVAVTTCNYTAVTMRFGKDVTVAPGATPPPPLPTVSLRAKKIGNGLTLMTVPGGAEPRALRGACTTWRRGRSRPSRLASDVPSKRSDRSSCR